MPRPLPCVVFLFVNLSLLQIGAQPQAWGFKPRFEDVQERVQVKVELDKLQTFKMHVPCSSIAGLKHNQVKPFLLGFGTF
jgi:hypothetical protein